jgi:hypothetical protein
LLISKQNPIRADAATKIRYFSDRLLARFPINPRRSSMTETAILKCFVFPWILLDSLGLGLDFLGFSWIHSSDSGLFKGLLGIPKKKILLSFPPASQPPRPMSDCPFPTVR